MGNPQLKNLLASGGSQDAKRLASISESADRPTLDLLAALNLEPGSKVIDIGCGTGSLAHLIAQEIVSNGEVIALDHDLTAVLNDQRRAPSNVKFVESDVRTYAPRRHSLDLVHARFVLAHLSDRRDLLGTFASWLKPGGCVVITEPVPMPLPASVPESVLKVFNAYHQWVIEQGMSLDFATEVPSILAELGAKTITTHVRTSRFGGGPQFDRWLPLISPVAHHLVGRGITETVMRDFVANAAKGDLYVIPQAIITTCARLR